MGRLRTNVGVKSVNLNHAPEEPERRKRARLAKEMVEGNEELKAFDDMMRGQRISRFD